jgi:GntR family transcriptional regulator / MocR family aminotransferase
MGMDLVINLHGNLGIARQVYGALRQAILDGRLKAGEKLPSSREFSAQLAVARNTVNDAYGRLSSEGFITTRHGSGTYVARDVVHQDADMRHADAPIEPKLSRWARSLLPARPVVPERELIYDFRPGLPDLASFPIDVWRRLTARILRHLSREIGRYGDPAGHIRLREEIARYLAHSRAVSCGSEDVLVTNGSQQALDLIARILINHGNIVAVEDPGYPMAVAVFRALEAKIVPVPVDDEGLVVDRLPANARLVYVTPSHQFPLGVTMSQTRRRALLEWATRRGAVIVEDDYDSEFRFGGRPLESLQGLDRSEAVVYLGTLSKILFPGLRIGYVVAPSWLRKPFIAAKSIADRHTSTIEQHAMAAFIAEGHFARYIRRMQRIYGERRAVLIEALDQFAERQMRILPSFAGMHVTVSVAARLDVDEIVRRAYESGVGLYSIAPFYLRRAKPGLIFGYGATARDDIIEGLRRFRGILRTLGD